MSNDANVSGTNASPAFSPVSISEILMHMLPHLDEIVALYLAIGYGGNFFPGINSAGIRYVESDVIGTDKTFDSAGKLPIGCGSYENSVCRFNDHLSSVDNTGDENREGECATTLVANFLGIRSLPELRRIIDEVHFCDTTRKCSPTMLAELVKVGNRTTGGQTVKVVEWAFTALYSIFQRETCPYSKVDGEKTLLEWFDIWTKKESNANLEMRFLDKMKTLFSKSEESKSDRLIQDQPARTELARIVEAMSRTGVSDDDIMKWLDFAFSAVYADQVGFRAEVARIRSIKSINIPTRYNGSVRDGQVRLLVVEDSNHFSQKVARGFGNHLVLLVQPSGNFQIFTDSGAGLNLERAVSMIRYMALPPSEKRQRPNWSELECGGTHPRVPNLFYFVKGQSIFNGSLTHTAAPLGLSTATLVEILSCAFHKDAVMEWGQKHVRY